jgi:Family of unknown function (DUF6644)
MIDTLAALEQLPLAATLKKSVWLYPLVNTAHIVGIALLFGAIVPYDLRLLGLWRGIERRELARILLPMAAAGLFLAVGAGGLLFITQAGDYLASPFFMAKMAVLLLALIVAGTACILERRAPSDVIPKPVKICAVLSIALWLCVITLGRLIGYF